MNSYDKKSGYKNLIVWQKSMELVVVAYKFIKLLPGEERFNIGSQLSRSVVSIPSNIAEGWGRNSDKSFRQFLLVALGSAAEFETQIEIAKRLSLVPSFDFSQIDGLILELMKTLNGLIRKKSL